MLKLIIDEAELESDPRSKEIADALLADAGQDQLRWAYDIVKKSEKHNERVDLEAGLLRFAGKEYPVIALKMKETVMSYVTGRSCIDFFTKSASPEDRYTPGPKVEIVREG